MMQPPRDPPGPTPGSDQFSIFYMLKLYTSGVMGGPSGILRRPWWGPAIPQGTSQGPPMDPSGDPGTPQGHPGTHQGGLHHDATPQGPRKGHHRYPQWTPGAPHGPPRDPWCPPQGGVHHDAALPRDTTRDIRNPQWTTGAHHGPSRDPQGPSREGCIMMHPRCSCKYSCSYGMAAPLDLTKPHMG